MGGAGDYGWIELTFCVCLCSSGVLRTERFFSSVLSLWK